MTINQLYKAFLDGDPDAENSLFKKLYEAFVCFAEHRIDDKDNAEELVQEALMIISRKHRDIEFVTSFSAWAYKVLDNRLKHYIRKKYTDRRLADNLRQIKRKPESPDPELKMKLIGCLKKINSVNTRYARILNLRYQGYSTEEIGNILNISNSNVLVILSRARSLLRLCLNKGDV